MDELKNIELLRYINEELSTSEKLAFEESLLKNAQLQEELKVYKQIIQGVKMQERQKMKANIAAIGAALPLNSLSKYQPKPPPSGSGGNFLGNVFKFLISTSIVVGVGALVLISLDKFPIKHPAVEVIHEKMLEMRQVTVIDTVWTTIESDVITGDTVFYGQEEYDNYLKKLEESKELDGSHYD